MNDTENFCAVCECVIPEHIGTVYTLYETAMNKEPRYKQIGDTEPTIDCLKAEVGCLRNANLKYIRDCNNTTFQLQETTKTLANVRSSITGLILDIENCEEGKNLNHEYLIHRLELIKPSKQGK